MSSEELFELGIYAPEVLDERIIVYLRCGGGVLLKYKEYVCVLILVEYDYNCANLINPYELTPVNLNECKLTNACDTKIIYQNRYTLFMHVGYELLNKLEHTFNLNIFKNE